MPFVPLVGDNRTAIPPARLRPVPGVAPWAYRVAVPFIMLLSLSMWAVLWQVAAYSFALILG